MWGYKMLWMIREGQCFCKFCSANCNRCIFSPFNVYKVLPNVFNIDNRLDLTFDSISVLCEGENDSSYIASYTICDVDKFLPFILATSKKQMKKMGSKKSAPWCAFDRGAGGEARGSKDIWAIPMETTHFKKGLPLEYDWLIGEWLDTSVLMYHVLVPSTNSIRIPECRKKETMTIDNWDISQSP